MRRLILAILTLVSVAACSQVVGLDDLTDRKETTPQGGEAGRPDDPATSKKTCVFDTSHVDDGCGFGP